MTKSQKTRRARYTKRRGSMIVLAIGVLAVLAIVALSYTAAVRVERTGVQAYTARIDASRQVDAVMGEIQAVLTADLFGNKQVDSNTPRLLNPSDPVSAQVMIWPRMFEDGEFFDVPGVDNPIRGAQPFTFNEEPVGAVPSPESVLLLESTGTRYEPAFSQDDAWLGSTEPVERSGSLTAPWDTWPTITNLRSTYRWGSVEPGSTDPADFAWIRGDGKFVDLAQFFLTDEAIRTLRGDPDADLTDFSDPETNVSNGPELGVDQRVFDKQMSMLREFYDSGSNPPLDVPLPLELSDERFWADTDGDLRPDARWQILDSMGDLQGLKWVVATRIIDNSSMVNVNTALDFGQIGPVAVGPNDPDAFDWLGAGRTPADVDLLRLLRSARFESDLVTLAGDSWGDFVADPLNWAMPDDGPSGSSLLYGGASYDTIFQRQHVESQLRLQDIVNSWNIDYDSNPATLDYDALLGIRPLLRSERDRLFNEIGQQFGTAYGVENEIDLRAFWGVNREDTLSELEQRLDAGYLPRQEPRGVAPEFDDVTGAQLEQGPLRSADRQRHARGFVNTGRIDGELALRPTFEEIRDDVRRHLTTVSGASDLSPVPVINDEYEVVGTGANQRERLAYAPQSVNKKVRLSEFPPLVFAGDPTTDATASEHFRRKSGAVQRAYEAFTWALAPLATQIPVAAGLDASEIALIGASTDSQYFYGGGTSLGSPAEAADGAAYALLRAASLAVNLADAVDTDTNDALDDEASDVTEDLVQPTVARLHNVRRTPERLSDISVTLPAGSDQAVPDAPRVIELGTRFSHGDVAPTLLPASIVPPATAGVTLVGLDRQPFIREVVSLSAYRDADYLNPFPPGGDFTIDPTDVDEQIGSLLAVELGNPWPKAIDVRNVIIRFTDGTSFVDAPLLSAPNTIIEPGGFHVFVVEQANPDASLTGEWFDIRSEWQGFVEGQIGVANLGSVGRFTIVTPAGSPPPILFQGWDRTPGRFAALLLTDINEDGTGEYLIDRMKAPLATDPFPADVPLGYQLGAGTNDDTGRVTASASMSRRLHPAQRTDFPATSANRAGFPAYVLERSSANTVSPSDINQSSWSLTLANDPGADAAVNVAGGEWNLLGFQDRTGPVAKGDLPGMPSFQFFVPNRTMDSVGDLALLCAFSHVYIHSGPGDPILTNAGEQGDLNNNYPSTDHWRTVSEQLGADRHIAYDGQILNPSGANANPYLGMLDPTRFVLGTDLGPAIVSLPDSLAVPLAVRAMDAFEAVLSHQSDRAFVAGRINVNTAPVRTLRMLPFMSPEETIEWPVANVFEGALLTTPAAWTAETDRAGLLLDYIHPSRLDVSVTGRNFLIDIPGLRAVGFANRAVPGLAAAGEISLLAGWDRVTSPPVPQMQDLAPYGSFHFGELALVDPVTMARVNTGMETTISSYVNADPLLASASRFDEDLVLDRYPSAGHQVGATTVALDPIDDAEERTAVYRAMSNIVSTRSDVYTAWFVIRGYDPDRISAISVPNSNPDDDELNALMNQLKPTHESRWLAVFDRSNVRLPTDRPKILLLTKLPTR